MRPFLFLCSVAVLAFACGCASSNDQILVEMKKQRELLESQQAELRTVKDSLVAKEKENAALAEELTADRERVARVEHESQRPTFTVQQPTLKIEPPQVTFQPTLRYSPTPAPAKPAADLIIRSVTVQSTKANGKAWDESGPPDLKVYVSAGGNSFTTSTIQGTTSATYNKKAIKVEVGDTLEIRVSDGDVFNDDLIGSYSKTITADTIRAGVVDWSFDRVSSLQLEFQP